MIGRVVSVKMMKTAVVLVESRKKHPLYKKTYTWSTKYLVNDPIGVKLGDMVNLEKIKPMSKKKHWGITKVIGKDLIALGEEQLKEVAKDAIAEVLPEETEVVEEEVSDEKKVEKKEKSQDKKLGTKNTKAKASKTEDKEGELK